MESYRNANISYNFLWQALLWSSDPASVVEDMIMIIRILLNPTCIRDMVSDSPFKTLAFLDVCMFTQNCTERVKHNGSGSMVLLLWVLSVVTVLAGNIVPVVSTSWVETWSSIKYGLITAYLSPTYVLILVFLYIRIAQIYLLSDKDHPVHCRVWETFCWALKSYMETCYQILNTSCHPGTVDQNCRLWYFETKRKQ